MAGRLKIEVRPTTSGFSLSTPDSALLVEAERSQQGKPKQLKIQEIVPSTLKVQNQDWSCFADALLGVVKGVSQEAFYLLIVDKSRPVDGSAESEFKASQVLHVQAIPFPGQHESTEDRLQIDYIQTSLHSIPFLYFSHDVDLVRSLQDQALRAKKSPRESIFVWNWKFLEPLYDSNLSLKWIHPMVQGLVAIKPSLRVLDMVFDLVLITRRATTHQGTRFYARGLDENGYAANFCESEQILLFRDSKQGQISSFLQIRGSIPTMWKQTAALIPGNQRASLLPGWNTHGFALFVKHFKTLVNYGKQVVMVNLIDSKGKSPSSRDQAQLGAAFKQHVDDVKRGNIEGKIPEMKLIWFDFHHETKSGWDKLSKLLVNVDGDVENLGFFFSKGKNQKQRFTRSQEGCFRVNCMDNLDRTNVVQSILARRSVMDQLSFASGTRIKMNSDNVFDCGFPEFESAFKEIWADNADAVSLAYAGSNALKTDFTRYGKRGMMGPLQDAFNSVTRLFVNNFSDWYKQDQLDVLLRDDITVHRAISHGQLAESFWGPLRVRLGVLVLGSVGYFSHVGQQNPSAYLAFLVGLTGYVLWRQSKEKPRLEIVKRKGSESSASGTNMT